MILGGLLKRMDDRNRRRGLVQRVVRWIKKGARMAKLRRGQQFTEQAHRRWAGNRRNGWGSNSQWPFGSGLKMQMATRGIPLLAVTGCRVPMQDRV